MHRGVSAETAFATINSLPEKTPAAVLEAARPENSPIHNAFTWEDSIAANKYRMVEARRMLNSFQVVYKTDTPTDKVSGFVRITHQREHIGSPPGSARYEATHIALQNPEVHDRVLQEAYAALLSWKRKYEGLKVLSKHLSKVDSILQDIQVRLESKPKTSQPQRVASVTP